MTERMVAWVLVALLAAGCSLFRDPVATPTAAPLTPVSSPTATAAAPTPSGPADVEALIVAAAAEQTGYPEAVIRAMAAARGVDIEQVVANVGIPPEDVDDVIAEMRARGIDSVRELEAFLTELQERYGPSR